MPGSQGCQRHPTARAGWPGGQRALRGGDEPKPQAQPCSLNLLNLHQETPECKARGSTLQKDTHQRGLLAGRGGTRESPAHWAQQDHEETSRQGLGLGELGGGGLESLHTLTPTPPQGSITNIRCARRPAGRGPGA